MEELSDKDFDQIFKNKIKDAHLKYEEDSWLKMEKKLRKRERFILYRIAGIILLFITVGIGIYFTGNKSLPNNENHLVKKVIKTIESKQKKADESLVRTGDSEQDYNNRKLTILKKQKKDIHIFKNSSISNHKQTSFSISIFSEQNSMKDSTVKNDKTEAQLLANQPSTIMELDHQKLHATIVKEKINLARKSKPFTLSFNLGPDFNSTEKTIGGKSGLAIGLGVGIPITNKLSIQTGLNYGSKKYEAQGYDYNFSNPNIINVISGIDASCKVLEIPLRASYIINGDDKSNLSLNAGFSSYMMLKENYRFKYIASSERKDRLLEKTNANQHYLSVVDLSATYSIRLKNTRFAFGVEPYLKIPLSGIGEGAVPLKSSGISLKLNYELNKKN